MLLGVAAITVSLPPVTARWLALTSFRLAAQVMVNAPLFRLMLGFKTDIATLTKGQMTLAEKFSTLDDKVSTLDEKVSALVDGQTTLMKGQTELGKAVGTLTQLVARDCVAWLQGESFARSALLRSADDLAAVLHPDASDELLEDATQALLDVLAEDVHVLRSVLRACFRERVLT